MKKKLMSILLSAAVSVSMVAGMGAVVYADTAEDNEAIKLEKVKEAEKANTVAPARIIFFMRSSLTVAIPTLECFKAVF